MFVPSLAISLGVWSRSGKLFEVLYTVLWYIGPMNQMPALDFMGACRRSISAGTFEYVAAVTLILMAIAAVGRRRQLQA
jgi:hypothetical protein